MAISVSAKRHWWSRIEATETDAVAARLDAAVVVRALVAACAFGAAAIHFGFAPDHFGESRFHGAFFFLAGWAQLAFGLAVILRPSRAVLRLGILLNVAIVVLWVVSRVVGMPFGDDPWVAEAVTFPDTLATLLEVLAVVGSYVLLTGGLERRALPRTAAIVGGVGVALALVGLTTASVAPALSGGHSHGAGGHSHSDVASGATHSHTDVVTAAGAGGHDHGTGSAAVAAGIESGNGTSPCEQAGVNVEGNSHGHSGPAPQQVISDPATRTLLAQQLTTARDAALKYLTAADAMAAGYRRITTYIPCIAAHYINTRFIDSKFDPAAPEMLLFDGNGPDAHIVGLSYYVSGVSSAPEGFVGPNDQWHQHIGLCVSVSGVVIGGTQLTAEQCTERGGIKADGSTAWMVHAWVVPGWESAWGTFSGEHPELGRTPPAH
jgi:hypothetical protein